MGYAIAAVVVVLVVAGFVTFLVLRATRTSSPVADRPDQGPPSLGQDEPLGDTTEHAGEQTRQGTTAHDPERGRFERDDPDAAAHRARPGEGEGEERLEFDPERPGSERLANRDD